MGFSGSRVVEEIGEYNYGESSKNSTCGPHRSHSFRFRDDQEGVSKIEKAAFRITALMFRTIMLDTTFQIKVFLKKWKKGGKKEKKEKKITG